MKHVLSSARLVTLTGVGGVGKSRLARHVAQDLERAFPDGVWLVELAKLCDASLVSHTVAEALDVRDTSAREPADMVVDHLADKRLLLVLDNCEHLLGACAHLVNRLLTAAPGLRVLMTSREPIGIAGEHVWQVPPLSMPNPNASPNAWAHRYEALRLFEDRASEVVPGFVLNRHNARPVAAVCQRLDGLPLAIELAAVQVRALSVEQILAGLENRYRLLTTEAHAALPRHRTLRAAVEWSFDLCTELERTLWARMSVFADEFDLQAAEAVCAGDGVAAEEVLTGLAGLIDKSILVRADNGTHARYGMLDTIRQYGYERLTDRREELTLRRRHRDYCLRLSEQAEANWFGPDQSEWLNRFRAEQPNMWAALEFSLTQPDEARTGLRMASTLWCYSIPAGLVRDGRYWLDRALAVDTEPSLQRAKALWASGWTAQVQGDRPRALSVLEECADLAQRLGDDTSLAYARQFLGTAKMFQNLPQDAVALLGEAVHHYRAVGEINSVTTMALCQLALAADLLGDAERAVMLCEECMAICHAHDECWTRSWAQWVLAISWFRQGEVRKASTQARQALRFKLTLNDQLGIPFCVELLAWVAMADGDAKRAALLFGMGETMWESIGAPLFSSPDLLDWRHQCIARAREVLGAQAFDATCQRGTHFSSDAAVSYALNSHT